MRVNDESLDLEVLRHFVAMRDNLIGLQEQWLSLEQLMTEHGLMFHKREHFALWYNASSYAMCGLENLCRIVNEGERPMPLHWERWRRETARKLESMQAIVDMALTDL